MTKQSAARPDLPPFLYGTAWKEQRTRELTQLALACGFRGIDTANQRKHYFELAVGEGIRSAIATGGPTRGELFVQTKFTYRAGQDQRLPYDASSPVAEQVRQSFASSLEHLATDYVDSYLLHGPASRNGLIETDLAAWAAMEAIAKSGGARRLGVSNVSASQLAQLHAQASIKPAFVQNRCYASTGWDRSVREFCADNDIVYQGFSLLTANAAVLGHRNVKRIAARHGRSPAQVVFRFALQLGMLPLTGTTDERHMREDLACLEFELGGEEMTQIENSATASAR
jgi:diketogulonate reductase-like aldo/keto reductase